MCCIVFHDKMFLYWIRKTQIEWLEDFFWTVWVGRLHCLQLCMNLIWEKIGKTFLRYSTHQFIKQLPLSFSKSNHHLSQTYWNMRNGRVCSVMCCGKLWKNANLISKGLWMFYSVTVFPASLCWVSRTLPFCCYRLHILYRLSHSHLIILMFQMINPFFNPIVAFFFFLRNALE